MFTRTAIVIACLTATAWAQVREYSVQPKFEKELAIERVLERADAAKDTWIGEQDYEALNSRMKAIGAALKNGEGEFPPLAAALGRYQKLSLVEFKIIRSVRPDGADGAARIRVRFELGGENRAGGLLTLYGHMELDWSREGSDWVMGEAKVESIEEVTAAQHAFEDISERALGHLASYRQQLKIGLDEWRDRLDRAAGVDIYGHSGLAVGDYDGDGLEDLYITQPSGLPNRLYRNRGDSTFEDVSAAAGVDLLDDTSMALFADVENDGDLDLILILADRPLLLRNDGEGRFQADAGSGLGNASIQSGMLTGAALADYDNDGDLDLYVCAYDFWRSEAAYNAPTPYYDAKNGPPNRLFRNRGDGSFEDVTEAAGLMANNHGYSFAPAWADYDGDGDQDLYVANDFGRNNLYRNNGEGGFEDIAAEVGVDDLAAGMSAAWADYDGDGDLDLYVGNMWSSAGQRLTFNPQFDDVAETEEVQLAFQRHARGNSLFRNDGAGGFRDVSEESRVTLGRWAWSCDFVDFDNDGWEDIHIQNGYITGPVLDDL